MVTEQLLKFYYINFIQKVTELDFFLFNLQIIFLEVFPESRPEKLLLKCPAMSSTNLFILPMVSKRVLSAPILISGIRKSCMDLGLESREARGEQSSDL